MSCSEHGLDLIAGMVEPGSSVLDLGCGDGGLLQRLIQERGCRGYGIELDDAAILACVRRGVPVIHGDLEAGLRGQPDAGVDVVILNQSVQQVPQVDRLLAEALRVGRRVIVGFPNFGHWNVRWQVAALGRTPVTPGLPWQWYQTPNLHFFSVKDFEGWCRLRGVRVLQRLYLAHDTRIRVFPNLIATEGVYLIEKESK